MYSIALLLDGVSEIYQHKDKTCMRKVSFLYDVISQFQGPIFIFDVLLSDTELLDLGKCELLPSNESFWGCFLSLRMGFWNIQKFLENFMTDFVSHWTYDRLF